MIICNLECKYAQYAHEHDVQIAMSSLLTVDLYHQKYYKSLVIGDTSTADQSHLYTSFLRNYSGCMSHLARGSPNANKIVHSVPLHF